MNVKKNLNQKSVTFYGSVMRGNPFEMANRIAQVIYDKKGTNILALDVQGLSSITDTLILAEGGAYRHVIALAHAIAEEIGEPLRAEGLHSGDWVVLDYGAIMVHLFMPGMREKYALERLWAESKIVDLEIDVHYLSRGEAKE